MDQLQKTIEIEPKFDLTHWFLANTYERKQMYEQSISELKTGLEYLGQGDLAAAVGQRYKSAGYREALTTLIEGYKKRANEDWGVSYTIARYYSVLGEKEQALHWLQTASQHHHPWLSDVGVEPQFDSLRGDPRFIELVKREGVGF